MVDLTRMIQGGMDLATAFGKGDQAYQSAMGKTAQMESLIADASKKRNAMQARREARSAIEALGGKPEALTLIDAGYDPSKLGLSGVFGGSTPTDVRSFQMMTTGMDPADVERARRINLGLDGRASSSGFSQVKFSGADGRERIGVLNGRTGQIDLPDGTSFNPQTGAISATSGSPQAWAQPGASYQTPSGIVKIDSDIDPADLEAAQADILNSGGAGRYQLPTRNVSQRTPSGGAFVGRSPEEQAALTERAKAGVQLETLPMELGLRTQSDIEKARGVELAKTDAERQGKDATRLRQTNESISTLREAMDILPSATGSRIGALADAGAGLVGVSTSGAKGAAKLRLLAAKLVANVPRFEGPQSNIDVQFYREAAGDLGNENLPNETRMAAAEKMLEIAQQYAGPSSDIRDPHRQSLLDKY